MQRRTEVQYSYRCKCSTCHVLCEGTLNFKIHIKLQHLPQVLFLFLFHMGSFTLLVVLVENSLARSHYTHINKNNIQPLRNIYNCVKAPEVHVWWWPVSLLENQPLIWHMSIFLLLQVKKSTRRDFHCPAPHPEDPRRFQQQVTCPQSTRSPSHLSVGAPSGARGNGRGSGSGGGSGGSHPNSWWWENMSFLYVMWKWVQSLKERKYDKMKKL